MSDARVPQPVSGGSAPVSVYAADSVVTAAPDTSLAAVASELIEDGGKLVGIVSARDLLGAYAMSPE
jgi:CBS domain-containing protein